MVGASKDSKVKGTLPSYLGTRGIAIGIIAPTAGFTEFGYLFNVTSTRKGSPQRQHRQEGRPQKIAR